MTAMSVSEIAGGDAGARSRLRRAANTKTWLLRVLRSVGLGFLASIVVALASWAIPRVPFLDGLGASTRLGDAVVGDGYWNVILSEDIGGRTVTATLFTRIGASPDQIFEFRREELSPELVPRDSLFFERPELAERRGVIVEERRGWPWPCLRSFATGSASGGWADGLIAKWCGEPGGSSQSSRHVLGFGACRGSSAREASGLWVSALGRYSPWTGPHLGLLPIAPIWRGLLLNTACYAVGLAVVAWGWRRGVGTLRRWEGRCEECGYSLGGNATGVCPECGAGVSGDTSNSAVQR